LVQKIIKHFIEDHEYHNRLFKNYVNALNNDSPNTTEIFNKLRNSIKRHTDQEEVLYSEYEPEEVEILELVNKVRGQHRKLSESIDDSYDQRYFEEIQSLIETCKNLLLGHIRIEEDNLYPYFDKVLTKNRDKEIIDDLDMYDPIEE